MTIKLAHFTDYLFKVTFGQFSIGPSDYDAKTKSYIHCIHYILLLLWFSWASEVKSTHLKGNTFRFGQSLHLAVDRQTNKKTSHVVWFTSCVHVEKRQRCGF